MTSIILAFISGLLLGMMLAATSLNRVVKDVVKETMRLMKDG